MEHELFRLTVVYGHLIACSLAIGSIIVSDVAALRQLLSGDPHRSEDPQHLQSLQNTVTLALVALWVSGAVIVATDVAAKGMGYFDNPKLQAKIIVVCLLTLNGILLHNAVLPLMKKAKNLLSLPRGQRTLALFAGSFSAASWFYAALLGVGRPLSWKFPLMSLLTPYATLVAGGFAGMLALVAWAQFRSEQGHTSHAGYHGMARAY